MQEVSSSQSKVLQEASPHRGEWGPDASISELEGTVDTPSSASPHQRPD